MNYLKGALWISWLVVFMLSLLVFPDLFSFIEVKDTPNNSPPWYFILNDLKDFYGALMGFALSIFLIIFFSRMDSRTLLMVALFSLIWYGHKIGNGISIFLNTENVFDPDLATTNWKTHKEYLYSPWKSYIGYVYLIIVGIVGFIINRKLPKEKI